MEIMTDVSAEKDCVVSEAETGGGRGGQACGRNEMEDEICRATWPNNPINFHRAGRLITFGSNKIFLCFLILSPDNVLLLLAHAHSDPERYLL